MEAIFHEKQEGSLCAQHCLNALLQGEYFTASDLAELGHQVDETERQQIAEAGLQSAEYQHFLEQPSSNFDDSGYFSIQVLQRALQVWGVELLPFSSTDHIARTANNDPRSQQAYICNFRDHWFTVRKLGHQWFNLNSLLTNPELISDTYLALFLTQLQREGYSIFVVLGELPECDADMLLKIVPAVQTVKPQLLTGTQESQTSGAPDPELQRVLEESKRLMDEEDSVAIGEALAKSLHEKPVKDDGGGPSVSLAQPSSVTVGPAPSAEEVRKNRQAFLDRLQGGSSSKDAEPGTLGGEQETTATSSSATSHTVDQDCSEDEELQKAIRMSMQKT